MDQISIFEVIEEDIRKENNLFDITIIPWWLDPDHEWYYEYSICPACNKKLWTRERKFAQENGNKIHVHCASWNVEV